MASVEKSPLGKTSAYIDQYDASLLFPIARSENREKINIKALPFVGVDYWTGYEISWLNPKGKPQVRIATFAIACDSTNIIESKSFKLYLNSYNQTKFDHQEQVIVQMQKDLTKAANGKVTVTFNAVSDQIGSPYDLAQYDLIDDIDIDCEQFDVDVKLLKANGDTGSQKMVSHLLKSNCPVTGQPDWGTVFIEIQGALIDEASLLQYIISYRQHNEFHEHCVEQMFNDLNQLLKPMELTVAARYVRRGGLDINPIRSTQKDLHGIKDWRLPRQ